MCLCKHGLMLKYTEIWKYERQITENIKSEFYAYIKNSFGEIKSISQNNYDIFFSKVNESKSMHCFIAFIVSVWIRRHDTFSLPDFLLHSERLHDLLIYFKKEFCNWIMFSICCLKKKF